MNTEYQAGEGPSPLKRINPDDIPDVIDRAAARQYEIPEHPHIAAGLLPVGCSIWWGPPGCGKSTLFQAVEEWAAIGHKVHGKAAQHPGRCLVIDYEGSVQSARSASLRLNRLGTLACDAEDLKLDNPQGRIVHVFNPPGNSAAERLADLRERLMDAHDRGTPFRLVRIDTLRRYAGPPPQGENVADYDARVFGALDQLAIQFGVAIVVIHHPNKRKEMSGTEALKGAVSAVYEMIANKAEGEGLLKCHKSRYGLETDYPLFFDGVRGTWDFAEELTALQVMLGGTRRKIADLLAASPLTGPEIWGKLGDTSEKTVKQTVWRMHEDGQITRSPDGLWSLTSAPVPSPLAAPANEAAESTASFDAFATMRETLASSKMHPVWFVRHPDRECEPWPSAVAADRTVEAGYRWTHSAIDRGSILVLDRSQSYTSACESVPVAANGLKHTGPMQFSPAKSKLAGICQITVPEWGNSARPHPLGRYAVPDEKIWVPSGQVELLWKLHEAGEISAPVMHDSWMGQRTTGLFSAYASAVRDARANAKPGELADIKRSASIALRMLYSDATSQWWRPDWRAAIVAEAMTRLWVVAYRSPSVLVSMGSVDQTAWQVPPDCDPEDWMPEGYKFGTTPGTYHWGSIRVPVDTDLSGIRETMISPSADERYLTVTGPVPFTVWSARRG